MEADARNASNPRPKQTRSLPRFDVGSFAKGISSSFSPDGRPLSLLSEGRTLSPIGDESVRGYPTDIKPSHNGAKEIVAVVQAIEAGGSPCCIVGDATLIYYGAKRVMFEWLICVPTEQLNRVAEDFKSQSDRYEPFRASTMNAFGSVIPKYPRFKIVGNATFFVLMSSQACRLDVNQQTIEYDRWIRLPYPQLPDYTQSLLERWNLTDLEDIIDGMNLSVQWGDDHLDLSGSVDAGWAYWRETLLTGRELNDDEIPLWTESKREIWHKVASADAKKKRQGWKSRPGQVTRFWMSGQSDPRDRHKDYS